MKAVVLVVLVLVALTWAVEIIIQPDCWEGKDAYITTVHPDYNYGSYSRLHIDFMIRPYELTLIQFILPELPPEAELVSADLVLWCTGVSSDSEYIKIVAVQDLWHEGIVCWNTRPEYRPDKIIIASPPEGEDMWVYFNITTFVADWYSSEYENHGMYLIPGTESGVAFASSDNNYEDRHPKLIVRYSYMDVEETSWGNIKATYK